MGLFGRQVHNVGSIPTGPTLKGERMSGKYRNVTDVYMMITVDEVMVQTICNPKFIPRLGEDVMCPDGESREVNSVFHDYPDDADGECHITISFVED